MILLLLAFACADPVVDTEDPVTTTEVDADTDSDSDTDTDTTEISRPLIQHADFECDPGETVSTGLTISPEALIQAYTRQDNHMGVIWWTDGGLFRINPDTQEVSLECKWAGPTDAGSTDLIIGMRLVWVE